ncbi:MAG: rRNA maturation RNase YbeY [Actinomycetota bacterium]|nr:rRNA maturation RNase YbeY [Actinomycetota bacterium]
MEVSFDIRCEAEVPDVERLGELVRFVLDEEDAPDEVEVSLSFVDIPEMTMLNETYRHKEGPTDVLSFPMDEVGSEDALEDGDWDEPIPLGDIVIAPEVAAEQAPRYGSTFGEEIELLIVHGVLHLLGYDHVIDEEAEVMEAREEAILGSWRGNG